jgi:hypothetical protein
MAPCEFGDIKRFAGLGQGNRLPRLAATSTCNLFGCLEVSKH